MAAPQLKLQNTEVFVGLVGGHHAAQPGATSKYFTRTTGNGDVERVYVDGCTTDTSSLFALGGLQNYVRHAVEGGAAAVFVSGAGLARAGDYDRRGLMGVLCREIGQSMAAFDPDLSMTYAFVGVTDSRIVDFHRDRTVAPERLAAGGLAALQHEVDDWEALEDKLLRGTTLPSVLSLRFESLRAGASTNGHLCLVDLGVVGWAPVAAAAAAEPEPSAAPTPPPGAMLQQSAQSLASLVRLLGGGGVLAGATAPSSGLLSLVGEFLYGQSKTAFVIYLGTDAGAGSEVAATVELVQAARRLRSREAQLPVDRRVMFFYEKARYYQGEKYRLQDELADAGEEKEQVERDLDDVQRDFGEERDALGREVEHWQRKSGDLERALETVRAASAGAEADARWEGARLVTEKLQLRDELRRAEIEMVAAEDAKARLLDLHEGLQGAYNGLQGAYDGLDAVYGELVAAYRTLKDRFALLVDERADLQGAVADLERRAEQRAQQIAQLTDAARARDTEAAELAAGHARQLDELQAQLRAQTQRAREAQARAAQLETANKSLAVSQSEEAAARQATIAELSAQLEEHELQAARDAAAAGAELQASQQAARRLEADNAALRRSADQLAAAGEAQHDLDEQRLQWEHERDQLQRQIARLQTTAANSQRREAELREESEQQWATWEDEKNRSHQKYIRLKTRFRDAVEFAAGVQAKLDTGHSDPAGLSAVAASDPATPESPVEPHVPVTQEPAQVTAAREPAPVPAARRKPRAPRAKPATATATAAVPAEKHSRARRAQGRRVNYAESGGESSDGDGAGNDYHTERPDRPAAAAAAADAAGGESDDSEISFNPAAIAPAPKAPARRPAPRRPRKSVRELDAELATRPARKSRARAMVEDTSAATDGAHGAVDGGIGDRADRAVDGGAGDRANSPPKRKRAAAAAAAPKTRDGNDATSNGVSEGLGAAATAAGGVTSHAMALKKKRKLNLSRMCNLLGIASDRPAAAASAQAVKFAVPKIRVSTTAAAAEPDTAADSD